MAFLGGVVVNHVENDFDACAMQRFHHVAKFVDRAEGALDATRTRSAGQKTILAE